MRFKEHISTLPISRYLLLWLCCFCVNAMASVPASSNKPVYADSAAVIAPVKPALPTANPKLKTMAAAAGCYDINWASWPSLPPYPSGANAITGSVNDADGTPIAITMNANYIFSTTPHIYNAVKFNAYPSAIPDATVPATDWTIGSGGVTTMCFSRTVTNPVLLLSSLGASDGTQSRLDFSIPYVVLFDGGNMVYNSSTAITGTEGAAIIMFPGNFNCVTIKSSTFEHYTNITWGIRPQPFEVDIAPVSSDCTSTVLTASGGITYKWNGGDTPNQATNTFHQSGIYIVTVTNAGGCTTSASKDITVTAPVPNITGATSGCGSVTLTAGGGTSYLWDGGNSPNSATNTFTTSGTYHVTVNSGTACSATQTVNVTVYPNINPILTTNSNACGSVVVTASGGTSYTWDGGLTPNSATNTFTTSGLYHVTVSNSGGCTGSGAINVVVQQPPVVLITGNTADCSKVTLTASGGASYTWDGGDSPNSATNNFTTSGTYHVTVDDGSGCTATKAVTVTIQPSLATITGATTGCSPLLLTASGGNTYEWDGGLTPNNAVNSFTTSGTYHVKVTNSLGCVATASVNITVYQRPTATITGNTTGCSQVTLTASGGTTYLWDDGATPTSATNTFTASGTYHVTVGNGNGCPATLTVTVTIENLTPVITGNTNGCSSVTLTASGGTGYLWDGGSSPTNATNTFTASGTYHVQVSNSNGCTATATANVNVGPPVAQITGSTTGCGSVTLTATGGVTYLWDGGSSPTSATNTFTNSGTYTVTVTNADQCSNTASATVTVNPLPVIAFGEAPVIERGESVQLNPQITGGNTQTYLWSPAAGLNDATVKNPVATPDMSTLYTLTTTTAEGCTAAANINVTVTNNIIIPNTFTPNGDGVNDNWNITYLPDYKQAHVDIYNRNGTHLYHSIGYNKPWDGTYNGKPVPAGTYYYVIDLKTKDIRPSSGYVLVIR